MTDAVVIGECMVELSLDGGRAAAIGYAGDTFNTAVYLSRLGVSSAYATAIGNGDPFSAGILGQMTEEGLERSLVVEAEGRLPGLYAIRIDPAGERSFFYWRGEAPVRDYMVLVERDALAAATANARLVYVSAITLAVLGEGGRAELTAILREASQAGVGIALDTNYRARLWPDAASARAALEAVALLCRHVSTGEQDLRGLGLDADAAPRRWAAGGAQVVLRREDRSIEVLTQTGRETYPPEPPIAAVDTTGAGDAFNAGYLAAQLAGKLPAEAVAAGRRLARVVVQHRGAIVPRSVMPAPEACASPGSV